jgi:hypothetical protein
MVCRGLAFVLAAAAFFGGAHRAQAAMSTLDRLEAEDEIRQQISLYGFLADGDGVSKTDIPALANKIFAPNIVSDIYRYVDQPPIHEEGRDNLIKATAPRDDRIARRHFFISTHFDAITPTTAHTRTSVLEIHLTRNMIGQDCEKNYGRQNCGGQFIFGEIIVYHEDWEKTGDGWQKTHTVLRRLS